MMFWLNVGSAASVVGVLVMTAGLTVENPLLTIAGFVAFVTGLVLMVFVDTSHQHGAETATFK